MTNRISLDNIFNYIPNAIRKYQNDDDQIKSWAMRAFRRLDFNNLKYVIDIIALDVKNHKVKLPYQIKKIKTVDFLGAYGITAYNQLILDYPELDVTYLDKDRYKDLFFSLELVPPTSFDYYCKVCDNKNIYSFTDEPDVIQTPYLEGCVLIKFYREYSDDDDILLPEEPEALWEYLASFVQMKHWQERKSMGEQGSNQQYQQHQIETVNYYNDCKRKLVWKNFSIYNAKKSLYGESSVIQSYPKIFELYNYVV